MKRLEIISVFESNALFYALNLIFGLDFNITFFKMDNSYNSEGVTELNFSNESKSSSKTASDPVV